MELPRLGRYLPAGLPAAKWDEAADFSGVEEMISSGCNAFLIETPDASDALRAAEIIRNTPAVSYYPIFSRMRFGKKFEALCDDCVSTPQEALAKAGDMLSALSEVNSEAVLKSGDFRLLAWFYMRRGVSLVPISNPSSDDIYSYPVAECLSGDPPYHKQWLDNLRTMGQIENSRLVDRIRVCPKCSSPHVNYIDVCPSCKGIDISAKEMVHCFTCGRVGLMENFVRESSMVCPFCGTRLRHLGSDYDHPLESLICFECSHTFTDAAVLTSCHNCGARNAVNELGVVSYFTYRLSEKGRVTARVGEMETAFALFDRLGNVSYSYFEEFLDWNINMARRYKAEYTATLVAVRFSNMEMIGGLVGGARMAQMIDAITMRLKELLRGTDVVMRSSMGVLCFLLPHTNMSQDRVVTSRVMEMRDQVILENAPRLEISVTSRTFPESADVVIRERNAREMLVNVMASV